MAAHNSDVEPLHSLALDDISDLGLLHIFDDCLDENGTCTSADVAARLDLDTPYPRQNVAIRLSWLQRYGVVQQNDDKRWQFTTQGENTFKATLSRGQSNAITGVADEALLEVMHRVGDRLPHLNETAQALVRRQWTYSYRRTRR